MQPYGTASASFDHEKNQGPIATGQYLLSFGYGCDACPGTCFASQETELMIAHVVLNYEIKIERGRPADTYVGGACIAPTDVEMQVRLQEGNNVPEQTTFA
ncbi:cytochrome p450 [Lecanosticta acicola]|uniref:Cytochrome p450 n=1 Tax=Lecanosticta acicola TaxID=111012 RepID=A0AAI9ECW7_9PEZI|nr:cytochrome p450 [Lecanosticta acicola]